MPARARATLLPSLDECAADDRGSARSLDDVGAATVLGAMVEQQRRRTSRPPPREVVEVDGEDHARRDDVIDGGGEAFMKIR